MDQNLKNHGWEIVDPITFGFRITRLLCERGVVLTHTEYSVCTRCLDFEVGYGHLHAFSNSDAGAGFPCAIPLWAWDQAATIVR